MKKLWLTSILIATSLSINAQFSVSAKYSFNSFPEWESLLDGSETLDKRFLEDGFEYGLSYWFRLKNYRVEFMPEVSYQNLKAFGMLTGEQALEKESFFLTFNTLVYTLDITGDCNCPTWGKDGSFIKKGFFVGVNPGIGYHSMSDFIQIGDEPIITTVNKLAFRIGVSSGLDIGIAKWITLTPYATLNYTPALTWENLPNIVNSTKPGDVPTDIIQIQPGLRLTFRPDYLKEQRAMFR